MPSFGSQRGDISESDRNSAIAALTGPLKPSLAREILETLHGGKRGASSIEWVVASAESESLSKLSPKLPDSDLVPLIVDLTGPDLLSDRKVRHALASTLEPDQLEELFEKCDSAYGNRSRKAKIDAVVRRNWHPGKTWALQFTRAVGLPPVFAGSRTEQAPGALLEVQPFTPLNQLADFQQDLHRRLISVMNRPKGDNRAILTLPTGAGKTRTTVEALSQWMIDEDFRRSILWVAQSEELCEQAVQSFRDVWFDLGHRRKPVRRGINIGRHWGNRDVALGACDVVVASIQKLEAAIRNDDTHTSNEELEELAERVGVIVIDEAHRALAPSYTALLRRFKLLQKGKGSDAALIGLTATPRRTNEDESKRLHQRFSNRILRPAGIKGDPVAALREQRVLSQVSTEVLDYGAKALNLADDVDFAKYYREMNDIPPRLLSLLAEDRMRNRELLARVLRLDETWPVLLFACSVQHAHAMTALLTRKGRSAACVTGETRDATRRSVIERFREGKISVLCNYGVLTTGFDAPQVRVVVVARPTESSILYEQMVGRGMRGPAFGGTEDCLVIDVADNLRWHGKAAGMTFAGLDAQMREIG